MDSCVMESPATCGAAALGTHIRGNLVIFHNYLYIFAFLGKLLFILAAIIPACLAPSRSSHCFVLYFFYSHYFYLHYLHLHLHHPHPHHHPTRATIAIGSSLWVQDSTIGSIAGP